MQRSPSPRTQMRNVVMNSGKARNQRPNSANVLHSQERASLKSMFTNKARSSSARIPRTDVVAEKEEAEDSEVQEEHKAGCPWSKGRSRSRYRLNLAESSSGMLHPKPWGARNPNDIPCFCKIAKDPRESSRGPASRSPTRLQDFMSRHERQASRTKVAEIINALCGILDRKKLKLTEMELNLFVEKIKEKLQKYKDQPIQNQQQQQKQHPKQQHQQLNQKHQVQEEKKPTVRRPRTVQSLSPVPHNPNHKPVSRENLGDQPRVGSPVVGKLEAKKYFIEFTAEDQVPTDLNHIIGMMSSHRPEKQLVLMEDNVRHYGSPEELRQYTVMNAGLQVRHHAENTTLVLGNQGLTGRLKAIPAGNIIAPKQLMQSSLNVKPRRV